MLINGLIYLASTLYSFLPNITYLYEGLVIYKYFKDDKKEELTRDESDTKEEDNKEEKTNTDDNIQLEKMDEIF